MPPQRLTQLSHGAGCACKIAPGDLQSLLSELTPPHDGAVLVGADTADDAAAYKVSDDLALVTSVDFFTPIVDDPRLYGQIAAANALSDIYAMGARPICALNLVAYSLESLGAETLGEILRGGSDIAQLAGISIVGGHSIDDAEPKYGLAVTGLAHPDELIRNSTARAGDDLYLTKAIGGGIVSTAAKRGEAPQDLIDRAGSLMATLNADAAQQAKAIRPSAMTDVTGFGLLGHLHEMLVASGVAAQIEAASVPAIEGVMELLEADDPPLAGGTRRNRAWISDAVDWDPRVFEPFRWLLCDAMTSGGLLIAATPGANAPGKRIGRLTEGPAGRVSVSP